MRNVSILGAVLVGSILTQAASQAAPMIPAGPGLVITHPTANLSLTNPTITLSGQTKDKAAVTNVWYQLNGGGWKAAATTNGWTNWTAEVTLTPGTNIAQAYAVDSAGTASPTNSVKFTYVLTAPLVVQVTGLGTVSPNYNGKWLKIGNRYSMTAKAGIGFGFVSWSGSLSTNKSTLSFVMASNLTLTANFKDVTPPVLVILSPKVHGNVSGAALTVTGKASDNAGVTQVFYQLNGTGWNLATPNPGWSNWTAEVTLSPGTNAVQAYALDAAGNPSKTNSVSFTYGASAPGDLAPGSISGLSAQIASQTSTFTLTFGAKTFTATMLPGANVNQNSVGTYTYSKLGPTTALLTVTSTAPPAEAGATTVLHLTFTNTNEAVYSTTKHGTVKTGPVLFSPAPDLAPTTLAGDTVHAVDSTGSQSTIVFANGTSTTTDATGTTTASYTFTQYSPVGGLVTEHYTSPANWKGTVGYTIVTWSAPKAGSYIWMSVPPASSGLSTQIAYGTFTLP